MLLSTVSHVRHTAHARSRLFTYESPQRRVSMGNVSAMNGSKDGLSPQALVRVCLLEVLVKLLTPKEADASRKTSLVGAQGVVKKVMDFFTIDTVERLGSVVSSSSKPSAAASQPSLSPEDRQEVSTHLSWSLALARRMRGNTTHACLVGSRPDGGPLACLPRCVRACVRPVGA